MVKPETRASGASDEGERDERAPRSLAFLLLALLAAAAFLFAATAPLGKLTGGDAGALAGTLNATASGLLMITAAVAVYLGYRLYTGQLKAFRDLQRLSVAMAALSLITIVFGNWLGLGGGAPDSVSAYLLSTDPALHELFFEFKPLIALFTLPLAVAAASILLRYGEQLLERPWLRATVAVLIVLAFAAFAVDFALGAALAGVKPV